MRLGLLWKACLKGNIPLDSKSSAVVETKRGSIPFWGTLILKICRLPGVFRTPIGA